MEPKKENSRAQRPKKQSQNTRVGKSSGASARNTLEMARKPSPARDSSEKKRYVGTPSGKYSSGKSSTGKSSSEKTISGNSPSGKASSKKAPPGKPPSGKKDSGRFEYENDSIFWCRECNLPLIGEECGLCGKAGVTLPLSQPADVRFCSPYEREVLAEQLISAFGCDPLGDRIILLNKIPGEDKTDEIIVDGLHFGVLRFELSKMDYVFEPSVEGAKVLLQHGAGKKVELKKAKNRHLNGKNVGPGLVEVFSDDIRAGDFVLVVAGSLSGYGVSYIDGRDFAGPEPSFGTSFGTSLKTSLKTSPETGVLPETENFPKAGFPQEAENSPEAGKKVIRIRKIDSGDAALHPKVPGLAACIEANRKHLQALGKNAINTIRGIAFRREYSQLPVYVSFSGGKDSLVVLDLTRAALKQREFTAFFLNTGIEFPETVEFARSFCREAKIPFEEMGAGTAFWENVDRFGPPAKDFRWCCKVCKLASAGDLETGKGACTLSGGEGGQENGQKNRQENEPKKGHGKGDTVAYLTVDGKRKHESFSRARIAASETNPFVPNQLNLFPIRDWRAIEVWLYIHWRGLAYNPLYDQGFERVGCWLCPSALAAEYERVKALHPEMYAKWDAFLLDWAKARGLSEKFVEHGFWRWKELPPKMLKLAEELGISVLPEEKAEAFEIEVVSGISPCRAGGFSVEAGVRGIRLKEAAAFLNVLGPAAYAEELGMLLVRAGSGTVKFFSNGNLLVSSDTKEKAVSLFKEAAKQLVRLSRCTHCGICVKACPVGAVSIDEKGLHVSEACIRCGKCTESCVVTKYFKKLVPDFDARLKV